MAEKSRSLSFFLFICALLSGVVFYGCGGGGGTSSQHVPLQISGNVTSIVPLAGLRADSLNPELRAAASSLAGVEVYLESASELHSTQTDFDGKFLLSGVPAGSHYLVARVMTATGTLKVRSSQPVSVSDSRPTAVVSTPLALVSATASARGRIFDVSNGAVANCRLLLWGEPFYTNGEGYYLTPLMPENTVASIVVDLAGYQKTEIKVTFTENPPFSEQTIVNNSVTNRPPTSTLTASKYSVSPGVSVALSATASDPDQNLGSNNYGWSATIGTFSGSLSGLNASWIAPGENAPATITFTVSDGGGLVSRSRVSIVVGTGIFVPNNPPTISSITSSSTDGNYFGTLTYSLVASATDLDGDSLTYTWTATSSASAGNLNGTGERVSWVTPDVNADTNVIVTVSVSDGKDSTSLSGTFIVTKDPDIAGNTPPATVTISLPTTGKLFVPGEQITFTGSATDYNPATSNYVVMAASALSWQLIYPNSTIATMTSGYSTFSYTLPTNSGTYTVRLTATDKYQASKSSTRQFRINSAPNRPLISMDKANPIQIGTLITFSGSASDVEDVSIAPASLTWKFPSPINTQYGNTIATNTIPEGIHLIELSAKDSKGAVSASATLQVIVSNTGPTMTIVSPADESAVVKGQSVAISGSGTGVNNAPVEASTMLWQLWRTGVATESIASETNAFNYTFNNTGEHVLTLTGKDKADKTGTTQARFTVNATPSVSITLPASGTRHDLNAEITFDANLVDSPGEESYLIASWTSSIDGHFGSGALPRKVSDLSSGSHVITCEVINTRSGLSTSTDTMILVNSLPEITAFTFNDANYATAPGNIPVFKSENNAMLLSMTINTDDDEIGGELPAENIEWYTPANNTPFATGKTATQSFPLGLSKVIVRIYDSFRNGFEDQASATYNVSFHVWQDRILDSGMSSPVYMHGNSDKIYITEGSTVIEYQYAGANGANPYFDPATSKTYDLTATASISGPALAAVIHESKIMALGTDAGNFVFNPDIASNVVRPIGPAPASVITNISGNSSDPTIGYLTAGPISSVYKLIKFNPKTGIMEEEVTEAEGQSFDGLRRVRYVNGSPSYGGKVFAVDTNNKRIIRYLYDTVSDPRIISLASAPIDIAFTKSYVLILDENQSDIQLHSITSTGNIYHMNFGGFSDATGIYCSGKDLFVLEGAPTNRIRLIRSGETDWLKP